MSKQVFISYSTKDTIPGLFCECIELHGIECWMAPRDILAGIPYARSIIEGIKTCNIFLVFISCNSIKSEDVLNELDNAHGLHKTIIPIFLEDIELSEELCYYLKRKQWIDCSASILNGLNGLLSRLGIKDIRHQKCNMLLLSHQNQSLKDCSIDELKELADLGEERAINYLANCYFDGNNIPQNFFMAANYYRRGAQINNSESQYKLGLCYLNGNGVLQNSVEAVRNFQLAADQGHIKAAYLLSLSYSTGDGIEKDTTKAFKYLSIAANGNHPDALNDIAFCCFNGIGTNINQSLAIEYYKKAAQNNHAMAQHALGSYFEYGLTDIIDNNMTIIEPNMTTAIFYYESAANQGYAGACYDLYRIYSSNKYKDEEKAVGYLKIAAEQGMSGAQYELAELYEYGQILNENHNLALEWYKRSALNGFQLSIDKLNLFSVKKYPDKN